MRVLVLVFAASVSGMMAGCRSTVVQNVMAPAAECPVEFQDQVRIAASAVPWAIPAELAQGQDLNSLLGRRISVSISPIGNTYGMQIASSELAISPFGGTFRGWAQLSATSGIDVSPGRLRITPFVRTGKLQPQTLSVDVILSPGAEPMDEMVISASALWDGGLHPLAPERTGISLELLRHYTVYDEVDGIVSSTFVTASAASTTAVCTAETRVALVDRASATPPLWDLRLSAPAGRSEWWLAISDQQTGPRRVIFKSPAEADGFANWLHQTHALRVGGYQLGVFRPDYSGDARRTVPGPHSVTDTFRAVSGEDLDALVVGRLGET